MWGSRKFVGYSCDVFKVLCASVCVSALGRGGRLPGGGNHTAAGLPGGRGRPGASGLTRPSRGAVAR
eukprot:scaffold72715_cov51-Phaeocystis_antarctica.AAC.1